MNVDVQQGILSWYKKNKRDLPWRKTDDPYHVVVSELMLQQTQVDRVIPKYFAFLKRFPTVEKLAMASAADVIDEWAGLGYNRRALYLHKFAQAVVSDFDGKIPETEEELKSLPGIGPYTANAVLCFGFHQKVPVMDINIQRIYSRVFFTGEGSSDALKKVTREMVPNDAVTYNNALMDFGATVCKDKPLCERCPLQSNCSAYIAGVPEKYVKPKPQSKFAGSDRYYRSLVVKELRKSSNFSVSVSTISKLKPKEKSLEWFEGILSTLERDGLIVRSEKKISLPL